MNTNKLFKKITAVATGATMLGATVMGALAADLSDYPDMFVDGGTFNGYIVIGDSAKSADTAAAIDITNSMFMTSSGSATMTVVEGDSWLAETSSNFLELNESIDNIESYLTESELDALADGELANSKGTADYEQYLYLNNSDMFAEDSAETSEVFFYENDDDEVDYFLRIPNGDAFAQYVAEFTTALESDIDSNDRLEDIEDEEIVLFGKTYTIVLAENNSGNHKLTLMGGSVSATMEEGETMTYEVGGSEYEVSLLSVDLVGTTEEVQFTINGETTNKLEDGETDVLDDGTTIGVYDITYQEYAGGIHRAKFFIGADKLVLTDSGTLKVNEETINGASVTIDQDYNSDSDETSINEISVLMESQDDYYIGVGEKLSEAANLDEGELLFTENWDIELAEIYKSGMELISTEAAESDEQLIVSFEVEDGEYTLDVAYVGDEGSNGPLYSGEDSDELFVMDINNYSIAEDDYFFLHSADPTDEDSDAKSFLLRYDGADAASDDNPKAYFTNLITGETYERSLTTTSGPASTTFDLKLGGETFTFANGTQYLNTTATLALANTSDSASTSDDFDIIYTGSSEYTGWTIGSTNYSGSLSVRTAANHELILNFSNVPAMMVPRYSNSTMVDATTLIDVANTVDVIVQADDSDKWDDSSQADDDQTLLDVSWAVSSDEVSPTKNEGDAETSESDPDDSDVTYYYSTFGSILTEDSGSSDSPADYDLEVPSNQAEVKLYVTSGATYSYETSAGSAARVAIPVDANKFDSEISSVSAQNLIVVGGPCVNTVAAELMGNPSNCAEGFTPGVARIKLFENGDSVAMLVAGYSADDTTLAGEVIATRASELSGMESTIEGSTSSSASISSVQ